MNDEFMTQLYEVPRSEFADALYERLSQQPKLISAQMMVKNLTLRNAIVAFALLFLIAACVYAVAEKRWNRVGDIWVDVQKTLKLNFDPSDKTTVIETPDFECVTVEKAREILRFDFRVPAWAPEGFTFDNRICGIDPTADFAGLYWKGADQYSGISITLNNLKWFNGSRQKYEVGPGSTMFPVAPGSYEEVQIHGEPAVLVRGDWEWPWKTEQAVEQAVEGKLELKWDKKRGLQLYWVQGEVLYYLNTQADIPAEDLIRMAESAR